jgi:hypothetical protein
MYTHPLGRGNTTTLPKIKIVIFEIFDSRDGIKNLESI